MKKWNPSFYMLDEQKFVDICFAFRSEKLNTNILSKLFSFIYSNVKDKLNFIKNKKVSTTLENQTG